MIPTTYNTSHEGGSTDDSLSEHRDKGVSERKVTSVNTDRSRCCHVAKGWENSLSVHNLVETAKESKHRREQRREQMSALLIHSLYDLLSRRHRLYTETSGHGNGKEVEDKGRG